jgi:hypothetical protein
MATNSLYDNISFSEVKYFTFLNGPQIMYREVFNNSEPISFKVAAYQNFKLVTPQNINLMAKAPFLVMLSSESGPSPFALLGHAISCRLASDLDYCANNNVAYLNTSSEIFEMLKNATADGCDPKLIFTVALRHITFGMNKQPRMKYVLTAVEKEEEEVVNSAPEEVPAPPKSGAKRRVEQPAKKKETKKQRKTLILETPAVQEEIVQEIATHQEPLPLVDVEAFPASQ